MAKRNLNLLTNNEVVNDEEATVIGTTEDVSIETTDVVVEIVEEVVETVTDVADEVNIEELVDEVTVVAEETENTILCKRVYAINQGAYIIKLQLNDTGEIIETTLNIKPSKQNGDLFVSDYITHYYTSKLKYKNFTIVSIK